MARIIIDKDSEVFAPQCKCGERIAELKSVYLPMDFMYYMDKKGWMFKVGPHGRTPTKMEGKIFAHGLCQKCTIIWDFNLELSCGLLVGWHDVSRLQVLASRQGSEATKLQEVL